MWTVLGDRGRYCDALSRRDFLRVGLTGIGGLGLAELMRLRAAAGTAKSRKAVIMVCLNGGPSHLDMYDMKPEAPAEIRGEFSPIRTNVPGVELCELMPRQAAIADKLAVVRSLRMIQPNHQLHECYTGYPTDAGRPSFGSAVGAIHGRHPSGLPRYVGLGIDDHPRTVAKSEQPRYLGQEHAPFAPSEELLTSMTPSAVVTADRFRDRRALLSAFDRLKRNVDTRGQLAASDVYRDQALDIITSTTVRDAFDVSREPQHVRERYGEDEQSRFAYQFGHTWRSTFFLQARRLVEAGVPVVTLAPGAWDMHGGPQGPIFDRLGERLPLLDRSLHALVTDLHERGLADDVLVLMWGEFGRTPRVNTGAGRDHWTRANFALFAGGGLQTGQVLGGTDRSGYDVISRPYGAQNVMAVVYRHLGIDPGRTFDNFAGRPTPLLDDHEPIAGLF